MTEPGVGTNRFSYSFNDPINLYDPTGNQIENEEDPLTSGLNAIAIDGAVYAHTEGLIAGRLEAMEVDPTRQGSDPDAVNAAGAAALAEARRENADNVLATGGLSAVSGGAAKALNNRATRSRFGDFLAGIFGRRSKTCSFHGDTLVLTDGGMVEIRAIQIGERVWSRNPQTGEMGWQPVLAHYSNPYDETVYVRIRDVETGAGQVIVSNRIHPFFVQRQADSPVHAAATGRTPPSSEGHIYTGPIPGGAWIDAAAFTQGDRLLNDDQSWAVVVSVEITAEPLQAFNLTVAEFETYFVAETIEDQPIWVHNKCFYSELTERINVRVKIESGMAVISFREAQATSLARDNINALAAELREQGVQNVVVNSGRIVEPTGRLQRILQRKADTQGSWAGLDVWATNNPENAFVLTGRID